MFEYVHEPIVASMKFRNRDDGSIHASMSFASFLIPGDRSSERFFFIRRERNKRCNNNEEFQRKNYSIKSRGPETVPFLSDPQSRSPGVLRSF